MTLQRTQIVDAALQILSRDGLEGVTVRKVAAQLGVHVGGLYWHVKSKQDLLDEMANTILSRELAAEPARPGQGWPIWLGATARRLRAAMLAYREGGRVVAGARLHRAVALAELLARTSEGLRAEGFGADEARWLCVTVVSYTFGFVIEEQAGPTPETVEELRASGPHHPLIAALIEGVSARPPDRDADFEMGLRYIIAGAQATHAGEHPHETV